MDFHILRPSKAPQVARSKRAVSCGDTVVLLRNTPHLLRKFEHEIGGCLFDILRRRSAEPAPPFATLMLTLKGIFPWRFPGGNQPPKRRSSFHAGLRLHAILLTPPRLLRKFEHEIGGLFVYLTYCGGAWRSPRRRSLR
jgi:hypothetical protein